MGANYDWIDSNICKHCEYRYTFDCDDGLPYPPNGCENFRLDTDTIDFGRKALKLLLITELLEEG